MERGTEAERQHISDQYEKERIHYQWTLDSIKKLRFFFCGLVFAMLSFALQFQVENDERIVVAIEMAAWVLLAATGYFSLKDCGGFANEFTKDVFAGLSPKSRRLMWQCFFGAIILLMIAKGSDSYLSKVEKTHNHKLKRTVETTVVPEKVSTKSK